VAKLKWSVVALASLLYLAGCSSHETREPESDYIELTPLIYDYGVVFDCASEAITDENFPVLVADRSTGEIETKTVRGSEDRVKAVETGRRIKARVLKKGEKNYVVRFAATKLERKIDNDVSSPIGEWKYVGKDDDLLEKLKKRFDMEVDKRYKAAPGG
jgi:uncharacterized lipoprotein